MLATSNIKLFIVEDDDVQAQVLYDKLLEFNDKLLVARYKSGEELIAEFEKNYLRKKHYYVILDYFLQTNENSDALNGLEIIKLLAEKFPKVNCLQSEKVVL